MTVEEWGAKWGINPAAIGDLQASMARSAFTPPEQSGESEAAVQTRVRLEASEVGVHLWRNNVGVTYGEDGVPVRYGLANDSKNLNLVLKSSDLIGIRPVRITQGMVGTLIGQFVAREVKHAGWVYKGTAREKAQSRFLTLIKAMGGDACFAAGTGTL